MYVDTCTIALARCAPQVFVSHACLSAEKKIREETAAQYLWRQNGP